jgi:hypothetical protein
MVSKTLLRFALAALLAAFATAVAPAQSADQDDVAAAARKAREQQKNAPKPKKIVTNDDIPSKPTSSDTKPATTDTEGDGAAAAQSTATPKDEDDPKKEAYWHKKYSGTHNKLVQAEKDLDVLQRELNSDQVQYYNDPQKALVEQHNRSDINEKTSKVDAKKKEIESFKQQLSDLEDECRKAGCDPGWVR